MHETPRSLYIGLPASKMRSCAGLPRLLINLALNAFEAGASRRDFQHQKGRAPCLLVMDEFFTMGPMDRIEAAAGQMAGFGVKLLPVLQDLSQLQTLYPKSWQTFAGNCGVMWFFGNTDLATLEFLEKRLGQTRVYSPSRSDQSYDAAVHGGATGASFSLGSHPLMSVPELARIFQRDDPLYRALVLSTRHGPMIVQRAFYDAHPAFRGLFSAAK
jgi:type IV secretion system protein VirD4